MSTTLEKPKDKIQHSVTSFDNIYYIKDYQKKLQSSDYYVSRQGNTMLYYRKQTQPYQYDLKIKNLIIDCYSDSFEDEI